MNEYNLIVVGSGPGGYVAAIRAAQLGLKTAVVERSELGGVCLNWGCIPSKALLRNAEIVSLFRRASDFGISCDNVSFDFGSAIDRSREVVDRLTKGVGLLFRKNKIDHFTGEGALQSGTSVEIKQTGQVLTADHIIVATGARARSLPSLPLDGNVVITSREALEKKDIPSSIVIVGGGATGCEFAYTYNAYGAQVTMVELLPNLLPNEDEEVSRELEKAFGHQGISIMTGAKVTGVKVTKGQAEVAVEHGDGNRSIECGLVLVAVGVQGNTEDIGLEEIGVQIERGFIVVDNEMKTGVPTVSAIGDVTGKMLLAHVASAQGVLVAERLAGKESPEIDYELMPRAVYCKPQIASWGLTEKQAKDSGAKVKIGRFPFSANGKALGLGEPEGFVKVVVDEAYGEIIGAHLIGAEVTEGLAELSLARTLEGTTQEVGALVHAHPTLSEVIKEAALAAQGEAIHI
ncbi:dihydrolipoyl dehydrogenase [SAR202 cluster bacterium AD-802-E10_MRT_200m]|nr:dihydrolipoyl dehydrogenase [SAR202 cluster bacterium AD-802-E10_MRT_200m]